VFFPGEALLPKKKKTVNPALNTDLITFLSEKIILEEMGAIRRIDQNMKYKKKQHETEKAEKKKTGYLLYVYNCNKILSLIIEFFAKYFHEKTHVTLFYIVSILHHAGTFRLRAQHYLIFQEV
jgi:hypothetical protein